MARKFRLLNGLWQRGFWGGGSGGDPDRAQVVRARAGDRTAFDALVRTYERPLRGFVARRLPGDAVDDALQETWVAAWVGLQTFDRRARFKAWVFGIALHKCADYHRRRARPGDVNVAVSFVEDDESFLNNLRAHDPYAGVDLRDAVRAALETLPPPQREVIELYYYAHLTLAEIALVLQRAPSTVKYQFYRAHDQIARPLREAYAGSNDDAPAAGTNATAAGPRETHPR